MELLEHEWSLPSKEFELRYKFQHRIDEKDDMLIVMSKGVFSAKTENLRKDLAREDPILVDLSEMLEKKLVPVAYVIHPHIRLGSVKPFSGRAEATFGEFNNKLFGGLDDLLYETGRQLGEGPASKIQALVEQASRARKSTNLK